MRWIRKAAEQGDVRAQMELAEWVDEAEKMRWYRLASEQGDARASERLGELCEWGEDSDPREAVRWYRIAVEQGGETYTHLMMEKMEKKKKMNWKCV